ncbi:hypothetical protein ACTXGQ_10985 [Marinobacter sp. 1Y8]
MNRKNKLHTFSRAIRRQRDAIHLQLHLAHQDMKDEWEDLEANWKRFCHKLARILHNTVQATDSALRLTLKTGESLQQAYKHLHMRPL